MSFEAPGFLCDLFMKSDSAIYLTITDAINAPQNRISEARKAIFERSTKTHALQFFPQARAYTYA